MKWLLFDVSPAPTFPTRDAFNDRPLFLFYVLYPLRMVLAGKKWWKNNEEFTALFCYLTEELKLLLIPQCFRQSPLHIRLHILLFLLYCYRGYWGWPTSGKVKFSISEAVEWEFSLGKSLLDSYMDWICDNFIVQFTADFMNNVTAKLFPHRW